MSNFTDFFPAASGGGLKPKFEEFTSSGTFTPSQALIDAGGYIEVFLVAGGERGHSNYGGQGGEAQIVRMYLTSTSGCAVVIGAGGSASNGSDGSNSTFSGSSAGGSDITSKGGAYSGYQQGVLSPSWGGEQDRSAGNGIFGYGAGGAVGIDDFGGIRTAKANSGQGTSNNYGAASGYCLIKYYE